MMTDTARYSDYVLPCSHWFEYEDAVVYGNSFHLIHTEKAVEPAGESRCDMDIMRDLASRMGLPENFYQESNEAYLRDYFSGDACDAMGISYDALCEQKAIRAYPDPYQMWMDKTFLTPSTRVEFYIENPFPYNAGFNAPDLSREHMPVWFEPREALDTNALAEDFPFHLMSERPRYRVHGGWSYTQILRELDPEPTVKMNPSDAAANGLEDGQHVECYNDNGHAVAKLVLNEAIRPGCLVYPKSWQSDQHLAGGWSEPLSHVSDPVLMNQSFMDCRVAVRAWEE